LQSVSLTVAAGRLSQYLAPLLMKVVLTACRLAQLAAALTVGEAEDI